ncbi:hypothetical protein [Saccharothrix hoggarensis]|uniref:Secreted protein n=1 Tax=Saccharothrix hoggarensis TaxID=913853 RepID=A0ABW3QZ95_9PSEU
MSAVDQRVGTGASRVRRLLSRALLVAGGTLAGTAAAWALATSPASAQAPVDPDAVTGITQVSPVRAALDPVALTEVREAVRDLDVALGTPPVREPSPPDLGRVAEEIRGTVEHVGGWLKPARPTDQVATEPVVAAVVARGVTETTPATTAAPQSAGAPVVHGVFDLISRTWLETSRQPVAALPGDTGPSLPGDPSGLPSMPFAPLGAPVHCSCGGDGSGNAGGGSGPFSAVSADRFDAAVARALSPATERNVVMPGKQPGITPD